MRRALPVLIFTTMLTLAYSVFQGNVGTAYRQRSQLLIFYFMFVSAGYVLAAERREAKQKAVEAEKKRLKGTGAAIAAARRSREQEWEQVAASLSERAGF